jgi:hypothetical protein
MKKAKNPRKAIVIVSDGGDNHSHYTAAEIESLVRAALFSRCQAEAVIHSADTLPKVVCGCVTRQPEVIHLKRSIRNSNRIIGKCRNFDLSGKAIP